MEEKAPEEVLEEQTSEDEFVEKTPEELLEEKKVEEAMAGLTPEEMMQIVDESHNLQERYNEGEKVTEDEVEKIAKKMGLTKKRMFEILEHERLEEIEREKERALEPSDEEMMEQMRQNEVAILKKINDDIELTEEEIEFLEMIYGDEAEVRESIAAGDLKGIEPSLSSTLNVRQNLSLLGMIIKFFKNIFS